MEGLYLLLMAIAVICPLVESQAMTMKLLTATCSRALPILNDQIRETCCSYQVSSFRGSWDTGGYYLTRHFEALKAWQCAELEGECRRRHYDYSEFTSNVYDFYCNKSMLVDRCTPELRKMYPASSPSTQYDSDSNPTRNANNTLPSEWTEIVQSIDYASLKPDESSRPCVQIAQLDSSTGGYGEFHEILTPSIPFCRMTWCGYSSPVVRNGISAYNCIPKLCRANVIILMIFVIAISIAIVCLNGLVIAVFASTESLHNGQAIYKCSLAIADMLVGIFGLPSFAWNLHRMTWEPMKIGNTVSLPDFELAQPFIDWSRVPMPGRDGYTIRLTTGAIASQFESNVGNASGCLTAISLMVSLYSLTMAGFDRCLAVWKPLKYRRDIARKLAVYSTVVIWISAVIFAILPIVTSSLGYAISSVLYVVIGKYAEIFYIVLFGVPLCVVWVTNIVVFIILRRKRRQRRELTNHRARSAHEKTNDNRLAVTLMIIVGVFTVCCLPAVILSLVFVRYREKSGAFSPHMNQVFNAVDTVTGIILMSNSLWNYFIYSGRNKDFRKASITLRGRIRNMTFSRDSSAKIQRAQKVECATNATFSPCDAASPAAAPQTHKDKKLSVQTDG
uniref:Histamine receptor h2 n=1 Tax=Botryllus schlosseri TaxID=30301 RepID=A0A1Y0DDB2_BOTSH|nr:histamine receptor h2 [Botryllus schlosseri]